MIIGSEAYIGVTDQGVVITVADPDPAHATASIHVDKKNIHKMIKFLRSVAPKKPLYGGHLPYGLRAKEGHPHEVEKDFREIAIIDQICRDWREGDPLRTIARTLNESGILTRSETRWHHEQIKRILIREGLI